MDKVFAVNQDDCIRCAACSTIAPGIFRVLESGAHIIRQPASEVEVGQCEAAIANCPTAAISVACS